MQGLKRTHMCGQLNVQDSGADVVIMGWVQRRRDLGRLIFLDIRDGTGIIQVVADGEVSQSACDKAGILRHEFVVGIKGTVVMRKEDTINPKLKTGRVEVMAKEIKVLSKAHTPPVYIEDDAHISEALRLKYRYLDLRRPSMQKNIRLRHRLTLDVREFLDRKGFLEIETPMLTKPTPEGARDYLVPSRVNPGKFFALPQSPQLFKQLLMASGVDKYFQIARCFRDEDLRADRQPEFTQIDIEMAFVDMEDVISINEELISYIFEKNLGLNIKRPFRRITYKKALEDYGVDKPDTRFGMKLIDITDIVAESEFRVFSNTVNNGGDIRGINAKGLGDVLSRRDIDSLVEHVKRFGAKGLAWILVESDEIRSPISKFLTKEETDAIINRLKGKAGDLLLIVADRPDIVFESLGQLRLHLGKEFGLIDDDAFNFLWVTHFPLLEYDKEENRYVAVHHPFTSPSEEDIALLDTQPKKVRANAYDLVLNGVELGGGSIRIHDARLQQKMFEVLGFTEEKVKEKFGFLIEAFKYGVPPHGGIAFGMDRLVMMVAGKTNIRDVIAFPKTQNAACLMTGAPAEADDEQLKELHIKLDLKTQD